MSSLKYFIDNGQREEIPCSIATKILKSLKRQSDAGLKRA